MNKEMKKKLLITVILGVAIILLYCSGLLNYLSFDQIRLHATRIKLLVHDHYISAVLLFILVYTIAIMIALPVVAPMSLLGGYLFGASMGGVYSIIGVTIGATFAYFFVRYIVYNFLFVHYNERIEKFNKKINHYGYTYLLAMQLITIVPLFVINIIAGLAHVPVKYFIWTTVFGCAPLIFIYAYAGRHLGDIDSINDIIKPSTFIMLIILAAAALLPMIIIKRYSKDEL